MSIAPIPENARTPPEWRSAARLIDHTLLRPDATREQVLQLCREAGFYGFAAVFVAPCWTALAVAELRASAVKVGAPVGFPHGDTLTTVKRFEALELLRLGADELDMVMNIAALKSGQHELVESDIRAVVEAAHPSGAIVKVILETSLLDSGEKRRACELAVSAGADFVKTSTGFSGGGATVEDVALLRAAVGGRAGVKASGGIRTASEMLALLQAGADRIGTGAGVQIVRELGAPALKP